MSAISDRVSRTEIGGGHGVHGAGLRRFGVYGTGTSRGATELQVKVPPHVGRSMAGPPCSATPSLHVPSVQKPELLKPQFLFDPYRFGGGRLLEFNGEPFPEPFWPL